MLERMGINFSLSLIYILLFRYLISPIAINNHNYHLILLYLALAFFFTLLLEAWHYLLADLVKHPKVTIIVMMLITGLCLIIKPSLYMVLSLGYVDILMLVDLYKTYKMQKALLVFQKKLQ